MRLDAQAWWMPGCGRPVPSDAATKLLTDIYPGQDGPVGPQSSPGAVRPEPAEIQALLSLSQPPPHSESLGSSPSKAGPVRPVGRRHRGGRHPKRGKAAACAWGNDTPRPDGPHLLTKGVALHWGRPPHTRPLSPRSVQRATLRRRSGQVRLSLRCPRKTEGAQGRVIHAYAALKGQGAPPERRWSVHF